MIQLKQNSFENVTREVTSNDAYTLQG